MCESSRPINTATTNGEIIVGLGSLPEQALLALHERLALTMPVSALASCASYYGRTHRDPTVGELLFLDEVVRAGTDARLSAMTLAQLDTPDLSIAKTLHHLVQTKTGSGSKTRPLTLRRALSGAPCRTTADTQWALMSQEAFGTLGARALAADQFISIEGTGLCVALTKPERRTIPCRPRKNDLITLLTFADGADENAPHRIGQLLRDLSPRLHAVCTLRRGMMTDRLLKLCPGGLCTDLSLLRSVERPDLPLSPDRAHGCLLCTDESTARTLRSRAQAKGLFAITFGRLQNDGRWRIVSGTSTLFSLPLPLLRSLLKPRCAGVRLCDNAPSHALPDDRPSLLVTGDPGRNRRMKQAKVLPLGHLKLIHTTLPLDDALSPADVCSAFLRAANHLVASGADVTTLQCGIALCANSSVSPSAIWAGAIGWQRMLRLWDLTTVPPVIRTGEQSCLSMVLLAQDVRPTASTIYEHPSSMRLFTPAQHGGRPDARELHSLLRLTGQALSEGHIQALCPLWGEPPSSVLSRLDGFTPSLDPTIRESLDAPAFGLLVRSDRALDLGIEIGKVRQHPCQT